MKSCRRQLRCVNCNQPHMSNSSACPLFVAGRERRAALLEQRLVTTLRTTHPEVTVSVVESSLAVENAATVPSQGSSETYASKVAGYRTVTVTAGDGKCQEVVSLPKPKLLSSLAQPVKAHSNVRANTAKNPEKKAAGRPKYVKSKSRSKRANVGSALKMLQSINTAELQRMVGLLRTFFKLGAKFSSLSI